MKTLAQVGEPVGELENQVRSRAVSGNGFAVDTTFVLFFLAVEFGRTINVFGIDTIVTAITLAMLLILPYFLPSDEKMSFSSWLLGRTLIAALAVILGAMFQQTLGTVLPETFKFLPMTLLIVTAMLSCYIQFYSFFRFRLAK